MPLRQMNTLNLFLISKKRIYEEKPFSLQFSSYRFVGLLFLSGLRIKNQGFFMQTLFTIFPTHDSVLIYHYPIMFSVCSKNSSPATISCLTVIKNRFPSTINSELFLRLLIFQRKFRNWHNVRISVGNYRHAA